MTWHFSQTHTNIFSIKTGRIPLWWACVWFSIILGSSQTLPSHIHFHRESQWQAGPATAFLGPGAKWKCRASCSKCVQTCKAATAEHDSKCGHLWVQATCPEAGPNDKHRHRVWQRESPWPDVVPGECLADDRCSVWLAWKSEEFSSQKGPWAKCYLIASENSTN